MIYRLPIMQQVSYEISFVEELAVCDGWLDLFKLLVAGHHTSETTFATLNPFINVLYVPTLAPVCKDGLSGNRQMKCG